jgi:hypothetical protein
VGDCEGNCEGDGVGTSVGLCKHAQKVSQRNARSATTTLHSIHPQSHS